MDVVRHHNEPDAKGAALAQLLVQHPKQDSLGLIVVEQSPSTIHGKRHEMGVQAIIDDLASR
jgi:hypothetical protein